MYDTHAGDMVQEVCAALAKKRSRKPIIVPILPQGNTFPDLSGPSAQGITRKPLLLVPSLRQAHRYFATLFAVWERNT